jgi:crotonobetainyl-CoA:carnitine CoA-transferase CaiB-like acyl-CoA transferase
LRAAPEMGADTDALLASAGFTAEQIKFLREHAIL